MALLYFLCIESITIRFLTRLTSQFNFLYNKQLNNNIH